MAAAGGDEAAREKLKTLERQLAFQANELRAWWVERLISAPDVLREKMTLFWHGHFATSLQKVRDPYFMWRQNDIFRRLGLGSWENLLTETSKDPAMLWWLDGTESRKEHPNENFGREVMELFTLGEGHYTEKDVQEAARAFTGWTINRPKQEYSYVKYRHDEGEKNVLGQTGKWFGEDVLRILVQQPQCSRFIWTKIWRFFVNDTPPSDAVLEAITSHFESNNRVFASTLKVLFTSSEFFAPENRRSMVKSPVQWLASSVRQLQRETPPPQPMLNALRTLGQDLFAPPNVKGWDGGISWVTTNNLLYRYNFSWFLLNGQKPPAGAAPTRPGDKMRDRIAEFQAASYTPLDASALFTKDELASTEATVAAIEKRLLQATLKPTRRQAVIDYLDSKQKNTDVVLRHALRLVMSTPDYQLC
jgi:uncharacterized protein (DUF1800 family)